VAPGLATALGGPLAGMATAALSKAILGKDDGTADDVAAAVAKADPSVLLKIKECESDFQKHMADVGVDLAKIAAGDTANARAREITTKDLTPRILAYGVTVGFFGLLGAMMFYAAPEANKTLLDVMLGALGTAWVAVVTYYFGSSAGSDAKNTIINKALNGGK
ncbi:MAG: hypothetical protein ORN98_11295, partial [Alphaproteobacteria bacterium]|nr:hypothetical protein [Alphaproteobacteria bacterium]